MPCFQIPVYLVESPVLNEQCNAHKKTDTLMNGNKPVEGHVTRGLCLSEVSQIQHMVRNGKHAVPRVASIHKVSSSAMERSIHNWYLMCRCILSRTDPLGERDPDPAWTSV